MQVTTIRVSFTRTKQPAPYEKSEPLVELAAALDDGEDAGQAARLLLSTAAGAVYAALGMDIPGPVASKLNEGAARIEPAKEPAKTEVAEAEDKPKSAENSEDKPKRKRRTKAEILAAQQAENSGWNPADELGEEEHIPDGPAEKLAAAKEKAEPTAADVFKNVGAASADEKPGWEGGVPGEQAMADICMKAGKAGLSSAVREKLVHMNVSRVSALRREERAVFYNWVKAQIEAKGGDDA